MRTYFHRLVASLLVVMLLGTARVGQAADKPDGPARLKECLWVWGNPEMTTAGEHTTATFAQASPAQRAKLLGIPNIMMAGRGIPNDDEAADAQTKAVAGFPRLLWEISADGDGGPPFVYSKRIARVHRLVEKYPQIEGVILDDMSSVGMNKGFKAEHIAEIRKLLSKKHEQVKIWGVVYNMNLNRPGMNDCIKQLDGIVLCEWFADRLSDFEKHVVHCERLFPEKPIVMCTYLYDYGKTRRMPRELLKLQFDTAEELFRAGRIEGVVLVTIDNDAEAVNRAADWVKRAGDVTQDANP